MYSVLWHSKIRLLTEGKPIVGTAVCGVHANNFRTYMHVVTLTFRFLLKLFYLCQYFKLQSGFLYLYEKANQTFPL